jgi:hypothetical protein
MVRYAVLISLACLFLPHSSFAGAETDPRIARALALETVMTEARRCLQANQPAQAVALLEKSILTVNGNEGYLALMRTAYVAYLKELKRTNGGADRIEHVCQQLRILDPNLNVAEIAAAVVAEPASAKPDAPVVAPSPPPASPAPMAPAPKSIARSADEDPFQQAPLDRGGPDQKAKRKPAAPQASTDGAALAELPKGWQATQTGSFRVVFQEASAQTAAVAKTVEQLRTAAFERWSGPAGAEWSPRCDVWLHQTGDDYAKATKQPAASPGHSTVGVKDGRVRQRRIDLRLDDAELLDATLPREVAYVVVADVFPDQAPPRWSIVGMSIQSEAPAEVSRFLRALPRLTKEKKLFAVRDLLQLSEFPETDKITAFYVASVSLVDYLVRLKGSRAFALYLREAPRRGYEEALQRHYGIKDAAELQDRWLKFALKGE